MLKYLAILLDDTSVSYCHYASGTKLNLMPIEILKEGIMFAMKNDLKIQYLLPNYELPVEYVNLMDTMFHDNIGFTGQEEMSTIVVIDGFDALKGHMKQLEKTKRYVIKTTINDFFTNYSLLKDVFEINISINVVFTDVENFSDDKAQIYESILMDLGTSLKDLILSGYSINTNLITDRIALNEMNNCGAGDTLISLAPNGRFYPCPAFYYHNEAGLDFGDITTGVNIPNQKLFTLRCSPLCKQCDAYHCKRCVWLNKKMTYEIKTPSRQQCVMAHVERNASMKLLDKFHEMDILSDKKIAPIDYIDPFDKFEII